MFLLALAVIAACGDDDGAEVRNLDDGGSESGSATGSGSGSGSEASGSAPVQLEGTVNVHGTTTPDGGNLEVELDDFYFGPTFVEVESGDTLDVVLTNEGSAAHTFTIDGTDVDEEVGPGDTAEIEVEISDDLPLRYYCRFHAGQGMQGAFYAT